MTLVAISIRTRGLQQRPYEIAKIDEASDHFLSQPASQPWYWCFSWWEESSSLPLSVWSVPLFTIEETEERDQLARQGQGWDSGSFSELCAGAHCLLEDRFCSGQSCISYLQWTHAAAAAAAAVSLQSVSQSVSWRELLELLKESSAGVKRSCPGDRWTVMGAEHWPHTRRNKRSMLLPPSPLRTSVVSCVAHVIISLISSSLRSLSKKLTPSRPQIRGGGGETGHHLKQAMMKIRLGSGPPEAMDSYGEWSET